MKILIYGIQKIQIPVISKTSLRQKEFKMLYRKKNIQTHNFFFTGLHKKKLYLICRVNYKIHFSNHYFQQQKIA